MQHHFRMLRNFLILSLTTLVVFLSGMAQVPGLQKLDSDRADQAIQGLFEEDVACCFHKVHLQHSQKQLSRKAHFYKSHQPAFRIAAGHASRPFSSSIPDAGAFTSQFSRAPPIQPV